MTFFFDLFTKWNPFIRPLYNFGRIITGLVQIMTLVLMPSEIRNLSTNPVRSILKTTDAFYCFKLNTIFLSLHLLFVSYHESFSNG